MQSKLLITLFFFAGFLTACSDNGNSDPELEVPATYEFTRNGESTVSFSGQTTRYAMANELSDFLTTFEDLTKERALEMYRNATPEGTDANPFYDASLNEATKNIKSKVAASRDYFYEEPVLSNTLRQEFETWISSQVDEVLPAKDQSAEAGVPGQISDGQSVRYVNAMGLEYNQVFEKSLIGALMTDQALNNYLSTAVLDEGQNVENNNNDVTEEGKPYTSMEHKWDEAYGYVFGFTSNPANPLPTLTDEGSFLGEYVGEVGEMTAFEGTAQTIFDAFKRGRTAIVAGEYDIRNEQANIIRKEISKVIAVRAVYYLQAAKFLLEQDNPSYGSIFHDLSEAYGFIYSLQFSRTPSQSGGAYFTHQEVNEMLNTLMAGQNGLWVVTPSTLQNLSSRIAGQFNFSIEDFNS